MLSKLNKMVFNKRLIFIYALTYLKLTDFAMLFSSLSPDCGILYDRHSAPSHLLFFDGFRSICHGYPMSLSLGVGKIHRIQTQVGMCISILSSTLLL